MAQFFRPELEGILKLPFKVRVLFVRYSLPVIPVPGLDELEVVEYGRGTRENYEPPRLVPLVGWGPVGSFKQSLDLGWNSL